MQAACSAAMLILAWVPSLLPAISHTHIRWREIAMHVCKGEEAGINCGTHPEFNTAKKGQCNNEKVDYRVRTPSDMIGLPLGKKPLT